jgi:hypothetical protein
MQRILLLLVTCLAVLHCDAQWFYFPLPNFDNGQAVLIKKKQYRQCNVYLEQGNDMPLLLEQSVYFNASGRWVSQFEMKYEDERRDTASKKYFRYDAQQRLRGTTYYDEEQEILSLHTYNSKGLLVLQEVATIDPPRYTYKYDARGCLASALMTQRYPATDANGDATGKTVDVPRVRMVYTCNSKRQIISEKTFSMVEKGSTKPQSEFRWGYDAGGKVKSILQLVNGENEKEWNFTYNKEGLLVGASAKDYYSGETRVYRYQYE